MFAFGTMVLGILLHHRTMSSRCLRWEGLADKLCGLPSPHPHTKSSEKKYSLNHQGSVVPNSNNEQGRLQNLYIRYTSHVSIISSQFLAPLYQETEKQSK